MSIHLKGWQARDDLVREAHDLPEGLWVRVVPVLSTEHLPKDVCDQLQEQIKAGERAGADYQIGMYVWLGDDNNEDDPPELNAVFDWCRERDISYVAFDCDGDTIDGLPTWEW